MPTPLSQVADEVTKHPTALLLGAGAAIPSGAPSGDDLAKYLTAEIDASVSPDGLALSEVAEILVAKHGRRPVVEAIARRLSTITPSGGILALPLFQWRAVYSTNYDMLVESAFRAADKPLTVIRSDFDFVNLDGNTATALFKLHGCISQDSSSGHQASLVLTESDYVSPTSYRDQLFYRLQNDISASGIVILGQRLRDKHLSDIVRKLAELQKERGYSKRITVVSYTPDENYALIFENLGVKVTFAGIDEFFTALEKAQAKLPQAKPAATLSGIRVPRTILSFSRYIVPGDRDGSSPKRIYNGRAADYPDIDAGLTFRRDLEDEIVHKVESGQRVTTILGVAGTGKTTTARRVLLECARRECFCLEHVAHEAPVTESWLALDKQLRVDGRTGVLFIDDVTRYQRVANELVKSLSSNTQYGLKLLVAADTSQWNPRQKHRAFFEDSGPITLGQLSDGELQRMLELALQQPYLRGLMAAKFNRVRDSNRLRLLKAQTDNDMFLAMRLVFDNDSIDTILLNEYSSLSQNAQEVYRIVFGLQAAGMSVHRQLALRLLNFSPAVVPALLEELEDLVIEKEISSQVGVYTWETRHQRIAEILSGYKYEREDEKLALLTEVVDQVNMSEQLERQYVADLCTSEHGIKAITDSSERVALYSRIIEKDPRSRIARHRLIREFIFEEDFDSAETQIREAENIVKTDPPIQRYRVLVLLRRSQSAAIASAEDAKALLRRARQSAEDGIRRFPDSKYLYLILADVAQEAFSRLGETAWLKDALTALDNGHRKLLDPELESRANRIRNTLGRH